MSQNEICRMDAVTLSGLVRSKKLSATEATEAVLARMEKLEPTLHAFCTPAPDFARKEAARIDGMIAKGEDPGALAGVPIGIKDLICTKDLPTVSGSYAYKDFTPDEDDVAVERLKDAGAVIIGKTNVPEFGYSGVGHNPVFETTRNPWNIERTPGGSSAGSGAAVAAGMGPVTVGSDGGGSVRIPSGFCGLYGLKASMGRVPLYPGTRDENLPGVSSWECLEHIGPMTRTVADSALMLSVIAGPDPRDQRSIPTGDIDWTGAADNSDIKGLKIAYSADWGYAAVDPEVREIVGNAVQVFADDLGCTVEEAHPGWEDPIFTWLCIVMNESDLVGMRKMVEEHGQHMTPHLVDLIQRPWTAEDFTNAVVGKKAVNNKMWKLMANYDLLITPTLATPPFGLHMQGPDKIEGRIGSPFQWLAFTFPINLTGQPAASIPAGFTSDGLPVGMQIIGRHLGDETVLRASAAFEAARPWRDKWPAMLAEMGL